MVNQGYVITMRRIKKHTILQAKNLASFVWKNKLPKTFVHKNVQYFSQWESPELVEKIINKSILAHEDSKWRNSGAKSKDEYTTWSWSGCGMACLKMILATKQHKVIPLVELGQLCTSYGGYKKPIDKSPGLFYKPFVKFVKNEFGLNAKATSSLTLVEIKRTIANGGYVIASVTPEIRFPNKIPKSNSGHLILIFGYNDINKSFTIHNPSGFTGTQRNVEIPYGNFKKFFSQKGIAIV